MDQDRLVQILSDLPLALLEDFELEEIMSRLGDEIAEVLDVAGAGVMLEDEHGALRFVAGSDPVLRALERLQVEYDEGPCLLAYRTGEIVHSDDLAQDDRFARFAEAACGSGMGSVHSYPLLYRGEVIGALNLYDTEPRPLPDGADQIGQTLAGVATSYLMNARDITRFRTENAQLTKALDRRITVEQAKGYLRAVGRIDAATAWEVLRRHARSNQTKAEEVARQLLDGELEAEVLLGRLDLA